MTSAADLVHHSPACLAASEQERLVCAYRGCPVLEEGRDAGHREQPYRSPAPPPDQPPDPTPGELAFWDRAASVALAGSGTYSRSISDAALAADALLRERRKRFGVR